jgi:hypothetical protein
MKYKSTNKLVNIFYFIVYKDNKKNYKHYHTVMS